MTDKPEPKKPTILDRSRLEQFATCPRQGYLTVIWEALKAREASLEVFSWELKILLLASTSLVSEMKKRIKQSTGGIYAECGTQIHKLIQTAFKECHNDLQIVPQWFVDNLPAIQPNIQPMAIRHARHVADMLADYHVSLIGVEMQISMEFLAETDTEPAVIGTTCIDLLGSGKDNIHVADWKTGFKRRSNTETLDSFQAGFICLLIFSQPEYASINTIHFWYFETMFGTRSYARFDRDEEHPRLPGLSTEVALLGRAMEAAKLVRDGCKDAWPLPESCLWCDMITFCPEASMEAMEIADDPGAFVDRLVVLQAMCKKWKTAATRWVKGHGPLEGTKVVLTKTKPSSKFTTAFEDKSKPKSGPTGVESLDSHFERKE